MRPAREERDARTGALVDCNGVKRNTGNTGKGDENMQGIDRNVKAQCEAPGRMAQVSEQVQCLTKAIAQMSEVRQTVEARLSAILHPSTPSECGTIKNTGNVVPLAGELERLTDQIVGITCEMENMLSRIEL